MDDREVRLHLVIDATEAKAGAAEGVVAVDTVKNAAVEAGAEGSAAMGQLTEAQVAFAAAAGEAAREVLVDQQQLAAAEAEAAAAIAQATAAMELQAAQAASDAQYTRDVAEAQASLAVAAQDVAISTQAAGQAVQELGEKSGAAASSLSVVEQELLAAGQDGGLLVTSLERVKAAFDKVDNSTGIGVKRAVAAASVEVDLFREKIQAAEAAGVKFGPAVAERIRDMNVALEEGIEKASRFANAQREITARVDLSSDAMRRGAMAGGSFRGMLLQMDAAAGGVTGTLGNLALGFLAFEEAAKLGWKTGKEIDKFLKEHGVHLDEIAAKLITTAGGYDYIGDRANNYGITLESTLGKHNRLTREINATELALKLLGVRLHDNEAAQALATAQAVQWEAALAKMIERGDDLTAFAKRDAEAITKWADSYLKSGKSIVLLSTELQNVITAAKESTKAFASAQVQHEKFMDSVGKAAEKIQQSYAKEAKAADASALRAQMSANAKMKALASETLTDEEYSARKKTINDELTASLLDAEEKRQTAIEKEEQATRDLIDKTTEHKENLGELLKEYVKHELAMKNSAKAGSDLGKVEDALKSTADSSKSPLEALALAVGKMATSSGIAATPIGVIRDGLQQMMGPATTLPNPLAEVAKNIQLTGDHSKDANPALKAIGGHIQLAADHTKEAIQPLNALGVGVQSLGQQMAIAAGKVERLNRAFAELKTHAADAAGGGGGSSPSPAPVEEPSP